MAPSNTSKPARGSSRAYFTRGALLSACGLLWLASSLGARTAGHIHGQMGTRKFEPASQTVAESLIVDFTDWSDVRIKAYSKALDVNFPEPMAIVEIPKLLLRAPLFEGVDDLTLDRGLGHIPGTALPEQDGNLAIAGHRDSFFRVLKDIREGDVIEITTSDESETYVVERISVVNPSNVEVLKPRPKPTLTLVTCYPFYFIGHAPQRFIVEASLARRSSRERQQLKAKASQGNPDSKRN